jgi:hypothetical protein
MRYLETIVKICAQGDEHMEYGICNGAIDLVSLVSNARTRT